MHDLVIRGGMLIDGSGSAARAADVAIDGEQIVEVGSDIGAARRTVDADGKLVTPGFVDMHTHYDAQATWDPELTPSGWHGVTTAVMGNCGVGFAPVAPDSHDWLIQLMEGVEDIPGAALHEGISWEWESFPEYLDALDSRRWVLDMGAQMPHGALRAYVMGDRATADASASDIERMADLTREALEAGALGFSTSRTPLHRSVDGELVPGTFAAPEELLHIARAMKTAGHGVFQCALHHPEVPESMSWLRAVAATTDKPVIFNLNQPDTHPELWREEIELLEKANSDGLQLLAQVPGRPVGILESWPSTAHPFMLCPTWGLIAQIPADKRMAELRKPEVRANLITEAPAVWSDFVTFITRTWDKLYPFAGEADYEPDPSGSVAAIASREGRTPEEVAYDHLMTNDGRGLLYFPLFNYVNHDIDHLWELHQHPLTRMGLADGGAHCGTIADGGMPTFMLQFWARDRARGKHLPLELLVHRQTRQTAELYGLLDRGVVAPGMRADINVIDFDRLSVELPHLEGDLPTGANRYVQRATGYQATVCRGAVTVVDDEFTGELPGRLIRGPKS